MIVLFKMLLSKGYCILEMPGEYTKQDIDDLEETFAIVIRGLRRRMSGQ